MAAPNRIFALNLGMQTVTLAEFRAALDGSLSLHGCKQEELIADPTADVTRSAQLEAAVERLRKALHAPNHQKVNFALPSQSVFTRFVKLPGATPQDVESIIGFEAQQNVPFPIDEVVWDYQIMGDSKDGNWNVALVAMKADQLGEINAAVTKAGFKSAFIDVAPMALYNTFRYSYSELSGCSLLVDIGARTTNLIFVEADRVFSRSIPVGGITISAALAKEFKQDITVGEKLKIEKGIVGLGGAYAEPEDQTDMRISKIVRNTMTRLHADIARSISFYRQNQGGSAPVRAYLCGGTVKLPYMVEFFSEKLQMPIEYFNPLRNVTIANQETADFVGDKTPALGEIVGCALRTLENCPVEINLRPAVVIREQDLARRKPFLVLASLCLLLTLGAWWFYFSKAAALTQQQLDGVNADASSLDHLASQFDALDTETKNLRDAAAPLALAVDERSAWAKIIDELGTKIPPRFIWITSLQPMSGGSPIGGPAGTAGADRSGGREGGFRRGGGGRREGRGGESTEGGGRREGGGGGGGPKIDALQLSGLYLANPPNSKEARIIDEFVEQLRKSPTFDLQGKSNQDVIVERTTPDGKSWAYAYTIILPLSNPISLP